MEWFEITIDVALSDLEKAEAIANMTVPYGIYTEDYSELESEIDSIAHVDLIDEELLKKDRDKAKIHIYLENGENPSEAVAFLRERLTAEKIDFSINLNSCEEDDWLNNWRQYFEPMEIGEKILINPSWYEHKDTDRVILDIDPGLSFGTGKHETTKLCLMMLEKYIFDGCTVLDVGTGSGILSIVALLLGAKSAFAVDIDPLAVKTAIDNAKLNKVSDRFTAVCGDLTDKVSGKYDIVVANIVADAIINLSKDVKRFMNDDSVYITSGIIDTRYDDVVSALSSDFEILNEYTENGWYCFCFKPLKN